uniref:PiggyBac transposable element-derived protein domain-containing protein n=1 Tax=Arion vulgaris TaxID=1028688 RepID=A0A0B6ZX71_9EUPU
MACKRKYLTEEEIVIALEEDLPSDIDTPVESSSDEELENNPNVAGSSESQNVQLSDTSSSDEETFSVIQRNWRKKPISKSLPVFSKEVGPVLQHFVGKETAADIFLTVLSESTIENVVFQTNLYIQQKQLRVKPVDTREMLSFMGLHFFFGYHRLPHMRHYWSSEMDFSTPIVPKAMQRDRYFEILANLHVNDNSAIPKDNCDKLFKIRPLIQDLNRNFQMLRLPNEVQSIDESMVLFKGRSSLKQYNPMKPIKRGYKIWCRADMTGYVYEFEIYQGKSQDTNNSKARFGLGGSIVDRLTHSLRGCGYVVMMDNYFTSVELFEHMKANKIFACGTVRSNRKHLPKLQEDKKLQRGDFDYSSTEQGITFFKWRDNKCVHLLSNYHGNEATTLSRQERNGTRKDVVAPAIVGDYNYSMGGVDKADMLRSLYDPDRKSKKWWHRLFFAMIEMAYVNAFVIYKEIHHESTLLEFRRNLAMGLIAQGKIPVKKKGRPSISTTPEQPKKRRKNNFSVSKDIRRQNLGAHWPTFVQERGRCEMCSTKKIQSKPHSKCSFCNVFLCCNEKKNCFYEYHV